MTPLTIYPLFSPLEVAAGTSLPDFIVNLFGDADIPPASGDVVVIAQKIVSKSEGAYVDLASVVPTAEALVLAEKTRKDPRLVELVLRESVAVIRAVPHVLIVRHRCGYVMANAGIDRSNVPPDDSGERVLLLPRDADRSARELRDQLHQRLGVDLGVVIADSFGRPWRQGVTHVALGAAGIPSLIDHRGASDRQGRVMEVSQFAAGDALASAAGLVMGEGAESCPVALLRGFSFTARPGPATDLIRPESEDLFS